MATNSKREQLILEVISTLKDISAITTVARKKLGFEDLQSIAETQLPYIAITAGLPNGNPKYSTRQQGIIDKFQSELIITITVYGLDNINPDQTISSLADDIWSTILDDPSRNKLALQTIITPETETGIYDPYYAFNMDIIITYIHDRLSI